MKHSKRWLALLVTAALALTLLAGCNMGNPVDQIENSEGYTVDEENNTWHIYTADGLKAWAEKTEDDRSLNAVLESDIDLSGVEWTPVGDFYNDGEYIGRFDGNSHIIRNLCVGSPNGGNSNPDYAGLFGCIDKGGTVMNLTLEKPEIYARKEAGAIAGRISDGSIVTGCTINGGNGCAASINESDYYLPVYVGGITGSNGSDCSITNCAVTGGITITAYCNNYCTDVGGIAGDNYSIIEGCTVDNATIRATLGEPNRLIENVPQAGGIVGLSFEGITDCHVGSDGSAVSIDATDDQGNPWSNAGPIVGHESSLLRHTGCTAVCKVNGENVTYPSDN